MQPRGLSVLRCKVQGQTLQSPSKRPLLAFSSVKNFFESSWVASFPLLQASEDRGGSPKVGLEACALSPGPGGGGMMQMVRLSPGAQSPALGLPFSSQDTCRGAGVPHWQSCGPW